uniref:Phosphatidylinositol N-acetylglucosaminyltransferase subunit P n=1 Tax=Mesocestoides corti TaxID=53468 RepID=A0A5K3F4K0_MESCO
MAPVSACIKRYKFTLPKSVNSPGPVTERGVYGFVIYVASWSIFGIYLLWAYVPHEYLHGVGLTYLPSRLWAVVIPWSLLLILFGGVGIYLWMNQYIVHPTSSVHLICDDISSEMSLLQSGYSDPDFLMRQHNYAYIPDGGAMPPTLDLSLEWVNKQIYLQNPASL